MEEHKPILNFKTTPRSEIAILIFSELHCNYSNGLEIGVRLVLCVREKVLHLNSYSIVISCFTAVLVMMYRLISRYNCCY